MSKEAKIILFATSFLLMLGMVMIFSSSAVFSYKRFGSSFYYLLRHLVALFVGVFAAGFFMTIPAEKISDHSRYALGFAFFILVAVLIPGIGTELGGARRWIRFFGFGFQPSEVAKFILIIYLADLTARKRYLTGSLRYVFFPAMGVISAMALLILLEPDMGSAISVFFIGMLMLFISGAKLKHIFITSGSLVPLLWLAIRLEPYRFSRIMVFFNPWRDPQGAGFQLIQSFIALGSGGLTGVGLGSSRQKLFYLPEMHTDFVFSILGEELGFLGTLSVLLIFALIIFCGIRMAMRMNHVFASRVVFGITMMIAFEAIVNIGVSVGGLPTKGLPLPFMSYGGSSLVCHLAVIGIILNLSRKVE